MGKGNSVIEGIKLSTGDIIIFQDADLEYDPNDYKKFETEVLKKIPLGRIADVSDVATAVAFLASNASSMITGTSILVDGGWTAI